MNITDEIRQIWKQHGLDSPIITLASNNNDLYIVIDDNSSIIRLMDRYGNIFGVAANRCLKKNNIYNCNQPIDQLTCKNLKTRDRFVYETILPLVFTGQDILP